MNHVLPPLPYAPSPSQSPRLTGVRPHLVVVHTWGVTAATTPQEAIDRFEGTVAYLERADVQVSAHVVYGGQLIPNGHRRAVQQVPWDRKAWTQAGANSFSYSVESADAIWQEHDPEGFQQLARIVGYLCLRGGIPAVWAKTVNDPGIARHRDLGPIGNPDGHTDPTGDVALWKRFVHGVQVELAVGGYRKTWGRGRWPAA